MNSRNRRWLLVTWLCAAPWIGAHGQGFYWQSTTSTEGVEDSDAVTEVYYMPGVFKLIPPGDEPMLIVRTGEKQIVVVNTASKTYTELTYDQWESTVGEKKPVMFAVPPSIQNLPPEERRKALDDLYRNAPFQRTPVVSVEKTAEVKTVSGLLCMKSLVLVDGKEVGTIWSTNVLKGAEALLAEVPGFFREVSMKSPQVYRSMAEALVSVPGFPVETVVGEKSSTVKKLERRTFEDDEFQPPSGYRKTRAQTVR